MDRKVDGDVYGVDSANETSIALPPMRQELSVFMGGARVDGVPIYTLHDPADHRFYQIDWPSFEILLRWSAGELRAIVESVNNETTLNISNSDVSEVLSFLTMNHLLVSSTSEETLMLVRKAKLSRSSLPKWLLKHYLFFRIPLFRPMRLLQALLPLMEWVYSPWYWIVISVVGLAGAALVSRQWDSFVHTFANYTNWQGVLAIGIALSLSKILHEIGHALTAYRYGCNVPHMGLAFLVLVPMLYTDTNEAWKLSSADQRLRIAIAGIAAEVSLAALATFAWTFLPDGPIRAGVFLLATSTWLITIGINISPFMRFDGYFLLSDWIGIQNLHERSFAFGRWKLRELLFGLGKEPPEQVTSGRRRFLIAFAYATWIYRATLFVGIALIVYQLFFKALGIFLLLVELVWFLAFPVQREIKNWIDFLPQIRWNPQLQRATISFVAFMIAICVPWPVGVSAPAVLTSKNAQSLYTSSSGRVAEVRKRPGESVEAGELLVRLESPDLNHQIKLAQGKAEVLGWQAQQQPFDSRLQVLGSALIQRLAVVQSELEGLRQQQSQLQMKASFSGQVVDIQFPLQEGIWVRRGEKLMQVVGTVGAKVEVYADESAISLVRIGDDVQFVPDHPLMSSVHCRLKAIDTVPVQELEHSELGSPFGGPISAKGESNGRAVPLHAVFRIQTDQCSGIDHVSRTYPGKAVIGAQFRSVIGHVATVFLHTIQRELSF